MVIVYILLLLLQVAALIFAICRKSKAYWVSAWITEALSAALAWGLGVYYDSLPGYGIMPGLTYFTEAIFGYGTAVISLGMLAVSVVLGIVLKKK
ncbi:MAG: hypothetical protein IJ281_02790 [Clostridia bacterium]|nr:hypothetical protein [Clostridia bacterium]